MSSAARLFAVASRRPQTADADLLAGWAADRDADAFAELVRRYGPLVWRTCRAVAGDTPSAEDAFQATFLALSRRAGTVTAVAGFLHRTAGRAARKAARRDRRPPPPPSRAVADPLDRLTARELLTAVDAEIARLPERQRLAVLLCGVDGLSTGEAARRLGWSAEAVRGRLQRGRAALRARLAAKGLAAPAVVGLGLVPDRLTAAAVELAGGGPVPAGVAKLVSGGLTMRAGLKLIGLVGVVGGIALAAGGPVDVQPPPAPADTPLVLWEGTAGEAGTGLWHPDGKHVLAVGAFLGGGKPHEVRVWDAATGRLAKSFPVPEPYLTLLMSDTRTVGPDVKQVADRDTLAVSPDGKQVAVGLRRKEGAPESVVAVWGWDAPADPPKLLPLTDPAAGVVFDRDPAPGRLYAVTTSGRLSAFRGDADPKPLAEADLPPHLLTGGKLGGRQPAHGLAYHPTQRALAVVHAYNNQISFWNPDTLERLDSIYPRAPLWEYPLAFRPDGRRLTLFGESGVGADRRLILGGYDLAPEYGSWSGRGTAVRMPPMSGPLQSAGGRSWGLNHLSYSPDGRFLALAGKDETARLADAVSAQIVAEWPEAGPVRAAHFSPDGRRLLTVATGAVRVRDVADKLVPLPPDRDLRLTHEKELDRFAGRWVVTAARIDGVDRPDMIGRGMSGQVVAVDPAVSPKAANVRREAGPERGELDRAVYEFLDADTYRICYSLDGDRWPTAFTAEKGSRQSLFTLKRQK